MPRNCLFYIALLFLMFSTREGHAQMYVKEVTEKSAKPFNTVEKKSLILTEILIDGKKTTSTSNTITLTASQKDLMLNFNKIEDDSASYIFSIEEDEFHSQNNYPNFFYHNVDGGMHLLEVQAKTSTGHTNKLLFTIIKDKLFYQRWWFLPLMVIYLVLIFSIAAYLFFLYDFRNRLKVQHLRNQIASDLHDEVGSNLSSIAIFIEVLKQRVQQEKPELLSILDKISVNSEETVSLMRETVWAINPENDSVEKLFERMKLLGVELFSVRKIQFTFENSVEKCHISMEQRRNIYLIYKEAINNIVKHSGATIVWVNISIQNNKMLILIKDNGVGFDKNEVFEGNGLKNFINRGKRNNIEVSISSAPQEGTEIRLELTV